ncbi:MAG TPA: hypothetical protein QF753_13005 [Victivallales bacterium]|nr:hypothetical protein [Victivallales bacterium]
MKKITLVLFAAAFLGCFITSAAVINQQGNIKNNQNIEQLNTQITAQYMKLINDVKPKTVAIHNEDCSMIDVTKGIKNNKSLESLNIETTALYTKLDNEVNTDTGNLKNS